MLEFKRFTISSIKMFPPPFLLPRSLQKKSCLGYCIDFAAITYACTYWISDFGYEILQNHNPII